MAYFRILFVKLMLVRLKHTYAFQKTIRNFPTSVTARAKYLRNPNVPLVGSNHVRCDVTS